MDIQIILKRIGNGDKPAFTLVVQHFQQPLFAYLGRMGLSQGVAEEIAQETFLRAWKCLHAYDPARAEFSTWLFTIARNLAFHELGRAAGKREVSGNEFLPDVASEGDPPADAARQTQLREKLLDALRALPVADRSALALAYFQELDLKAIARIEGCSTGAVKVRLHRAKQRLRQLLEEYHE
ncbi:MAG: hypothetical protein CTY16_05870 [Methylobacter sp.]|nr:MAG: hypothetical protein CTY16_05870 [Methylobacter sp.]